MRIRHDIEKRKGTFEITQQAIEEDPEAVMAIMGQMIIVKAEMMAIKMAIEYHAYSPLFREIEIGDIIPEYQFEISRKWWKKPIDGIKAIEVRT